VDLAETGARAATAMARLLGGQARPVAAFRQLPFLVPIIAQCTDVEPCRSIYAALERRERASAGLLNFFPGFPAADFEDCRPSIVAYAGSGETADALADGLAELIVRHEGDFDQPVLEPAEAIARARSASRVPIVIADVQDNPGAGASSDTTGILRALVDARVERAAIGLIVDPAAAEAAHRAGVGASISIGLGGHSGLPADRPLAADYLVEFLSDGRLETKGPYYGRSPMNLGPAACLRLGGVRIVVASHKAQMADLEMFRFVGIEPLEQQILVVKSSVHFRAHFAPIASEILLCRSPGGMPADTTELPWTRLAAGVRTRPNGRPFQPRLGR
jgi:microcystin degradation protein MlrC